MSLVEDQAKRSREASVLLRKAAATTKSSAIHAMGARLKSRLPDILEANKADVDQAKAERISDAKLDRLKLDENESGIHGSKCVMTRGFTSGCLAR